MVINWPTFNQWLIQPAYFGVRGGGVLTSFRVVFVFVLCHWVLFWHVVMSFHSVLYCVASNGDTSHCIASTSVVFFFCYLDRFFIHLLIICDFFIYKINFAPSPQHSHRISFGECFFFFFPPPINPSLLLIIQYDISWSNIEKSELRTLRTIPVNLVVPQKLGYFKSHIAILKVFS